MAFVSRAKRNDFFGASTCGPEVGPGCYAHDGGSGGGKASVKYSVPPFSSSCERGTGGEGARSFLTPGPGYYSTGESGKEIAVFAGAGNESSQFASRTTRLIADTILQKKAFTPGPGTYTSVEKWSETQNKKRHSEEPAKKDKGVAWAKMATAPSIPSATQSYGYEEGGRGELIQGRPPVNVGYAGRPGDQAGPGAYSPDDALLRPKPASLGFGKSKSARNCVVANVSKEVACRPGPGTYNASTPNVSHQNTNIGTSGFASATERNFVPKNAGALPGPGQYHSKSCFESKGQVAVTSVPPTQPLPTHSARQKATPGPGHYQSASDFDKPAKRMKPDKRNGFSSTSLRFNGQGSEAQQTPGPGFYSDGTIGKTAMSTILSQRVTGRYGVFGSTSQRFIDKSSSLTAGALTHSTAAINVGPGTYDPKIDVHPSDVRKRDTRTSVFVSSLRRLNEEKGTTPGVGEYEVANTFAPKPSAGRAGAFFLANDVRFKPTKPSETPGPGEYQQDHYSVECKINGAKVANKDGTAKALMTSGATDRSGLKRQIGDRASRFATSKTSQMPGPGFYDTVCGKNGFVLLNFSFLTFFDRIPAL